MIYSLSSRSVFTVLSNISVLRLEVRDSADVKPNMLTTATSLKDIGLLNMKITCQSI